MRMVFVMILRLFVDDDYPDRLLGTVQSNEDRQERLAFHDAGSLLENLRLVICNQLANSPHDVSTTTLVSDPQDKEPKL